MSFFERLFSRKRNNEEESEIEDEEDVVFVKKLKEAGGIFFYCESDKEGLKYLQDILIIEDISEVLCLSDNLLPLLKVLDCNYNEELSSNQDIALINCEYLIASDGSIMVSSDQIKHYKKEQLPKKIIIWAHPEQIIGSSSVGLAKIRRAKQKKIPTNITSIYGFHENAFSEGENSKQLYLLLVEK